MIVVVEWKSNGGAKGLPEETPNDWAAKKLVCQFSEALMEPIDLLLNGIWFCIPSITLDIEPYEGGLQGRIGIYQE